MLIQLREGLRNSKILKFVFVGIISVPFVFFGFGSYFSGGADVDAASVNGQAVPTARFEQANYSQQQRMRQMFGGRLPAELLNTRGMREDVLEALINEELMLQRAQADYYTVSDLELAKAVQTDANFQVDGKFDRARYEQILSANRSSPQIFEQSLRQQLVLQQLYQALSLSEFVLDGEKSRGDALLAQEREISQAHISLAEIRAGLSVTDAEIQDHYDGNPDLYMRPEQFTVSYIELDTNSMTDTVDISEAEIEGEYERRIAEFGRPEKRDASHILVTVDEDASDSDISAAQNRVDSLLERVKSGEAFAAVAQAESDDVGSAEAGGSLGEFERGVMTAAFDDAVFGLEQGQISDVVRTEFGFHIIQLNKVLESTAAPLEEVQDEVAGDLRRQLASELFADQRETLAAESFESPNSLDAAADALGVEVVVSDWISSELTDGLGAFPAILEAIQSDDVLNQGLNSELIELTPDRAVVLRLEDNQDAELKPLDEVRGAIETLLLDEAAQAEADAIAESIIAAVSGGAGLDQAAADAGVEFESEQWINRQGTPVGPDIVSDTFNAKYPKDGSVEVIRSSRGNGDPVVVALHAVRSVSEDNDETPDSDNGRRAMELGAAAFRAVQKTMRADASVTVNERVLDPDFVPYGAQEAGM